MTKSYRLAVTAALLALVLSTADCSRAPSRGSSAKATRIAGELRDLASNGDTSALGQLTARAESGNRAAQYVLATMYDAGNGVPQDPAIAAKWYRKAADQGDASAQFALGVMYSGGQGVARDAGLAVKWFRKSAEQGDSRAQWNLGGMYAQGEGVPKNPVLALMWMNLGQPNLKAQLSNLKIQIVSLERSMTPTQIAQAQKLSEDWNALRKRGPRIGDSAIPTPKAPGTGILGNQLDVAAP